jgi:ketosteroid isomerase-like protein
MKLFVSIFLIVILLSLSCTDDKIDIEKERANVKNTDIEFSKLSKKEGMFKAFLTYADDEAVILKNNSMPITGKDKIGKSYTGKSDTSFMLTWSPLDVFISKSADLAYTFGTYTLEYRNDTLQTYGTYVTIWKKQPNGEWKWVLDTGNEGLGK